VVVVRCSRGCAVIAIFFAFCRALFFAFYHKKSPRVFCTQPDDGQSIGSHLSSSTVSAFKKDKTSHHHTVHHTVHHDHHLRGTGTVGT
jgi:hypothetical protein